jgi:hypothetical protein
MVNFFLDVHPSTAILTLFLDGHCFSIASTVTDYSIWQMLVKESVHDTTDVLRKVLYHCHSCKFDIVFQKIWAKTNTNMS